MVVHRIGFDMVVGLNLGRHGLNFLFAKIIFGMNEGIRQSHNGC